MILVDLFQFIRLYEQTRNTRSGIFSNSRNTYFLSCAIRHCQVITVLQFLIWWMLVPYFAPTNNITKRTHILPGITFIACICVSMSTHKSLFVAVTLRDLRRGVARIHAVFATVVSWQQKQFFCEIFAKCFQFISFLEAVFLREELFLRWRFLAKFLFYES